MTTFYSQDEFVDLATYPKDRVERLAEDCRNQFRQLQELPTGFRHQDVIESFAALLRIPRLHRPALHLSTVELMEPTVTEKQIAACCKRLASNVSLLKVGIPYPADPLTVDPYRAAGEITGIARAEIRDEPGLLLRWTINTGPLAGKTYDQQIRSRSAYPIFMMLCGRVPRTNFASPLLLLNLEGALEIEFQFPSIKLIKLAVSKSQRSHNINTTRKRFRSWHACPLDKDIDCCMCQVAKRLCGRSMMQ